MRVGRPVPSAGLPTPPVNYDQQYMLTVTKVLELLLNQNTPVPVLASTIIATSLPTSGYGNVVGTCWLDGNGFVKQVRATDTFAPSFAITVSVGRAVAA